MRCEDACSKTVVARFFLAAFCCVALAPQAQAVIVGTTDTSDFSDSGSDWFGMNWDYVYQTGGGTSVAISGYHLLTAKHYFLPAGTTFDVNGDQFEVVSIASPPPDSDQAVGPDLRVLTVKNNTNPGAPLPGFYELYTDSLTLGQDLIIVGTGKTGEDHITYYTEDGASSREKRWGTNEYTLSFRKQKDGNDADTDLDWSTNCLRMIFHSGDTEYEAGYGDGDSGGGVFVNEGGVWKLAGVNLYRESSSVAGRYTQSTAAEVSQYADWINETIPEPATMTLLLAGAGLLISRRRKT